jgi:hypothetical protein
MSWLVILQIVFEIIKLLFRKRLSPAAKAEYLSRMRAARKVAQETGDTSELEKLVSELARG